MNIDEQFKDAPPVATYAKIANLLHGNAIQTTEQWIESGLNNCYAVHVSVDGTNFGTNGKGVTKPLARASGHAELMERLQGGTAFFTRSSFQDAVWLTRDELLSQCAEFFTIIADKVTRLSKKPFSASDVADAALLLSGEERAECIPFYSVGADEYVLVPVALMKEIIGSNGLAAGNTTEEAIVQGFSEIVERKCQDRFLNEKLTPPTIPDEYLSRCTTAWKIISDIRHAGYTVIIKDCSLGEGYPVIAAVILNKATHAYHVHFGAFPVFEIALERSLTESFQGRKLSNVSTDNSFFFGDKRSLTDILKAYVFGRGIYPIEFFGETPSYPFVPYQNCSNATNAQLLRLVLQYAAKYRHKLYIRDISFLNFPSFQLIVPGVSELTLFRLFGDTPLYKLRKEAKAVAPDLANASLEGQISYLYCYLSTPKSAELPFRYTKFSNVPLKLDAMQDASLAALCAAYVSYNCGNLQQALALTATCTATDEHAASLLSCLRKTLQMLLNGYTAAAALGYLRVLYSDGICDLLEEDFRTGKNPFGRFLPCCKRNCKDCDASCYGAGHEDIKEILTRHSSAYPAQAAMTALADCIRTLAADSGTTE